MKEKALSQKRRGVHKFINSRELNQRLAQECLTLVLGSDAYLKAFRDRAFIGINITNNDDNQFFNIINKNCSFKYYTYAKNTAEEIKNQLEQIENVLLALFPPKIKPLNNFEISDAELSFINQLIRQKNVILYLFGNPYVMNLIELEKAKGVVVAYQDFEVFQENAAQHFIGEIDARGKLPVTIKQSK